MNFESFNSAFAEVHTKSEFGMLLEFLDYCKDRRAILTQYYKTLHNLTRVDSRKSTDRLIQLAGYQ